MLNYPLVEVQCAVIVAFEILSPRYYVDVLKTTPKASGSSPKNANQG